MAAVLPVLRRGLKVLHVLLLVWLWLLLVLYLGFKWFERAHVVQALPAELEVRGVEWIAGQSGLREGCGVAVFRLTTDSRQQLHEHGLAALTDARQARGYDDSYYRYEAWQKTPDAASQNGMLGLHCGDLPDALEATIQRGLNSPGNYLSNQREAMLLVLPADGLVVYGYNG